MQFSHAQYIHLGEGVTTLPKCSQHNLHSQPTGLSNYGEKTQNIYYAWLSCDLRSEEWENPVRIKLTTNGQLAYLAKQYTMEYMAQLAGVAEYINCISAEG